MKNVKPKKDASATWDMGDMLRLAIKAYPWLTLAVMKVMEKRDWDLLRSPNIILSFREDLRPLVVNTLCKYPMPVADKVEDAMSMVLLKLSDGRFLKGYDAAVGHPRPYLMRCAWQHARVVARSMWRQYMRDNGIRPGPKKSKSPAKPDDADSPQRDAA